MAPCVRTIRDQIVGMLDMVGRKWVGEHKIGSLLAPLAWGVGMRTQRGLLEAWAAEN